MRDNDEPSDDDLAHETDDADTLAGESAAHPHGHSVFFRLLNGADVAGLADMNALIDAMKVALRDFSSGQVDQPQRTVLTHGENQWVGVMPARVRAPHALGTKVVTLFSQNAALNLPTHLGVMLLFSPHTGALVAMLDGRTLTELRTAAVSALSAEVLARDETDVLAIIGSGVQARSHLMAMETVFELKQTRVWSPTPEHLSAFVHEMRDVASAPLVEAASPELAVHGADLIVLATSATEPVIQSEWVRSGAHIVSIGACRPDQREIDPALVRRSRLFVDSRRAAEIESGDIVLGLRDGAFTAKHIAGELGEVIAGSIEGRRSVSDITLFKSVGLAVEDVVAAKLIFDRAVQAGVGLELEL